MKYLDDHYYLVQLQYLGFRLHGWQEQPKVKTVQGIINKTFRFIFKHDAFKILASGRTDAMVSANDAYFHLTTKQFYDLDWILENLNKNLPQDIRILNIQKVDANFNILENGKLKEYHYLFSHGQRNHPFCAPILTGKLQPLNIDLMQKGAKLFEGNHNFKKYTVRASEKTQFNREVISSEIIKNNIYTANFFPKESFIYKVIGPGFMRYQIRMMMGQLFLLGAEEIKLSDIQNSLSNWNDNKKLTEIAPASGLILHKNILKNHL
ncbi:tRNA pseudouridine(38-40) synthase TruA [Wenyingzhuangia sp. IMCC45467]